MSEVMDESTEMEAPEQEVQASEASEQESELSLEEKVEAMSAADEGEGEGEAEGEAKPEYAPNFKFKVMEEEHEIDEIFRPAIVSKEAEDKFRELYEKAYGLDHVKGDRDRFRDEFNTHKEALDKQTSAINTLSSYLDSKDFESFFQALDIPKAEIMRFALTEAQKETWTPEQRQQYDDSLTAKRRANVYQEQYNSNQSQLESLRQEQVVKDYQLELYRPEVQEFQQAFDQRNGKDAFRNEVAQLGTYHEKVDGIVKPVGELVQSLMTKFGPFMQTQTQSAGQPQSQVASPKDVPVIPNTGPAGQAPTHKAIKSLEDLERLADSL